MNLLKQLKKNLRRATAFVLAVVLTVCGIYTQPVHVAAENKKEYVSDVMLYQGTLADAQSKYPEYTFVEQDLGVGGGGAEVHMGYQTTTEASEAIRDIACMEMAGNYNTSDYDQILAQQKEHLKEVIAQLKTTIEEFRDNYEAGQKRALDAYDLLNKYYEDDTGLKMADFFLDTSGAVTEENYITLFLQANASTVNTLESILASATDAGSTLWLDRLVAMGDNDDACLYDGLLEAKMVELQGRTGKNALKYFDSLYHEDIELLNSSWESLREGLQEYADGDVKLSDGEETVEAYVEELKAKEDNSDYRFTTYGTIYETLAAIEYGSEDAEKKSLVDLFLKYLPVADNEKVAEENMIDEAELYAVLGSWTEGQRFTATTQGISELFWATTKQAREDNVESDVIVIDQEEVAKDTETLEVVESASDVSDVDDLIEAIDKVDGDPEENPEEAIVDDGALSVYAGVDRSFFESKIAMTCEASRKEEATGQSAFTSIEGYMPSIIAGSIGISLIAAGIATIGFANKIGRMIGAMSDKDLFYKLDWMKQSCKTLVAEKNEITAYTKELIGSKNLKYLDSKTRGLVEQCNKEISSIENELANNLTGLEEVEPRALKIQNKAAAGTRVVGAALMAVGLVLTIYSIVSAIDEYNKQKDGDKIVYTEIPDKMVDQSSDGEGMGPYVYYSVVKNQDGKAMDINNWTSDHWLALYTSKSKEGGRPILANDFGKICVGTPDSDTLNMGYIRHFAEYSAQNLVGYSKNKDTAKPVYFFYNRGEEPTNQTASTFGGGENFFFLMSALMLAIGIAGGFALGAYSGKKKETIA